MDNTSAIPERLNIAAFTLGRMAASRPDNVAFEVFDGTSHAPIQSWTYGGLEDAILRVGQGLLSQNLKSGDRALLCMGNSVWFPITFFACLASGIIPVAISDQLDEVTLNHICADCRPNTIVHDGASNLPTQTSVARVLGADDLDRLAKAPLGLYANTFADDPAYIVYSDGVSGKPKGALHAHRSILGRLESHHYWFGLNERDRILSPGATNWGRAIGLGLLDAASCGAAGIIVSPPAMRSMYGQALPILAELTNATILSARPTDYHATLAAGSLAQAKMATVRCAVSSGQLLPRTLLQSWMKQTTVPLYDGYEIAEISCPISSGPECEPVPGAIGRFHPDRKVGILAPDAGLKNLPVNQVGVLAIHRTDPALMLGYWNDATTTKASVRGAWFLTGDLAKRDAQGYISYEGRLEDLLNLDGYRVNPEEIEARLMELPAILDVAVAEGPISDQSVGLVAYAVFRGGNTPDVTELNQTVSPLLVDYKRPRKWVSVDGLPRTPGGKIARFALRQALAA